MRILGYLGAVALACSSTQALAWNGRGHMMVAAVAWSKMTPAARTRASVLVRLNPNYESWTAGVSGPQKDAVAFMKAATWPDEIRSDPRYTDDGYSPSDPSREQNIGYGDFLLHRYWHFKDIPFSTDGSPLDQPFSPNAVTQISRFAATLGDSQASDDIKSYDLSWLLHLVGDIHQPLHATSRFSSSSKHGDNGGNGVKVCLDTSLLCTTDHSGKLHSFWDGAVGSSEKPESVMDAALHLPAAPNPALDDTEPSNWVQESFRLAKQAAYATPVGAGRGPFRLTKNYRVIAGSVAERRIALAGERLAKLLNERFQ